jgi:hypothetical protein
VAHFGSSIRIWRETAIEPLFVEETE